jgi:hypothetical protein
MGKKRLLKDSLFLFMLFQPFLFNGMSPLQKLKATENTETKMKNRQRNHLDATESSKNLSELCALYG